MDVWEKSVLERGIFMTRSSCRWAGVTTSHVLMRALAKQNTGRDGLACFTSS